MILITTLCNYFHLDCSKATPPLIERTSSHVTVRERQLEARELRVWKEFVEACGEKCLATLFIDDGLSYKF